MHSVRSDGLFSLLQLAQLAKRSGLAGMAITDHDTLPDPQASLRAEAMFGIAIVTGVEISTVWENRSFHLLGYGFDPECEELRRLCGKLQSDRHERMETLVRLLEQSGIRISSDRKEQWRRCPAPGRMHLARELVRLRKAGGVRSAFQRYLEPISNEAPAAAVPLAEAIDSLHEAGGIAVLAHPPARLKVEQWQGLVAAGLDGLETRHPAHSNCHQRFLDDRAEEYGLIATAGSDYHGDEMRRYLGSHVLDQAGYDRIMERRQGVDIASKG